MLQISAAQRRFLIYRIPPGAGSIDEQRMSTASSAQTAMSMHSNALPELPKVGVCVYTRAWEPAAMRLLVENASISAAVIKKSQKRELTFLVHLGGGGG